MSAAKTLFLRIDGKKRKLGGNRHGGGRERGSQDSRELIRSRVEVTDAPAGTLRVVQEPPFLLAHRQFGRASLRRGDRVHCVEGVLSVAERTPAVEPRRVCGSGELPQRRYR